MYQALVEIKYLPHFFTRGQLVVRDLSLVVPVFNKARCLESTLESIIKVSEHYKEIIFVDDCSQDGSKEIIKSFGKSIPNLTLIELKENQGPYSARYKGITSAKTNWVQLLDADDLPLDIGTCVDQNRENQIKEDPNISAVCFKKKLRNPRRISSAFDLIWYGWPDSSNIILNKRVLPMMRVQTRLDWGEDHLFFIDLLAAGSLSYFNGNLAIQRLEFAERSIRNGSFINRVKCAQHIFIAGKKLGLVSALFVSSYFLTRTLFAWTLKKTKSI